MSSKCFRRSPHSPGNSVRAAQPGAGGSDDCDCERQRRGRGLQRSDSRSARWGQSRDHAWRAEAQCIPGGS